MFTGIISEVGKIRQINSLPGGLELVIGCSFAGDTRSEESISVNGVCLTVTGHTEAQFTVQCVEETLRKTTLGLLQQNDPVNLERTLTPEKALDGHIVQGHVDTMGTIEDIIKEGSDYLFVFSYPEEFINYIIGRGSVAIDGVSLTVAREESNHFTAAIIPYTWDHSNMNTKKKGDRVNLEFDVFGKYVVRYLENRFGDAD